MISWLTPPPPLPSRAGRMLWTEAEPDCSALLPNQLYAHQDYGFVRQKPSLACTRLSAVDSSWQQPSVIPRMSVDDSSWQQPRVIPPEKQPPACPRVSAVDSPWQQPRAIPPENRYETAADRGSFKFPAMPPPSKHEAANENLYDRIVVMDDDEPSYEELLPYGVVHNKAGTHQLRQTTEGGETYQSLIVRSNNNNNSSLRPLEPVYASINKQAKRSQRRPMENSLPSPSRLVLDRQRSSSPSVRRLQRELRRSRSSGTPHGDAPFPQRHLPPVCGRSPPCLCTPDEELAARLRIRILKKIASLRRRHIRLRVRETRCVLYIVQLSYTVNAVQLSSLI